MSQPFFSVLIPSYNRPDFLKACVDSILQSDFNDFEIVISDDKSPKIEEIELVLAPVLCRDNVTFIKQPVNLSWSDNRNFLVANAKGLYSILLGDDDKIYPYTLSRIKTNIEKFPGYEIHAIGYTVIDEQDDVYYSCVAPKAIEISDRFPNVLKSLLVSDAVPFWAFHPFTMCFLTALRNEVKYQKEAFIGDDLLFMFECMNLGKRIFVIPESLFQWRKAQNLDKAKYKNLSTSSLNNIKARYKILKLLRQYNHIKGQIRDFIAGDLYKKRFLYDPISLDKSLTLHALEELKRSDPVFDELMRGYQFKWPAWSCLKIRITQMLTFLRIFGIGAIKSRSFSKIQQYKYNLTKRREQSIL